MNRFAFLSLGFVALVPTVGTTGNNWEQTTVTHDGARKRRARADDW